MSLTSDKGDRKRALDHNSMTHSRIDFMQYTVIRQRLTPQSLYGGVYILPQKVFEGEFIHVISYAENFDFTTYSSNEFSVQIR